MPEGYSGLPPFYVESSDPITPNLGLSLAGADPLVAENFYLIDTAFSGISATVNVNGVAVPAPANFVNSASVTFGVVGSNISLTATGGGGGAVSSVSNIDGTLTISPTTGAVIASLNLGHANTWTAPQALGSSTATTQSPGTNNTEIATTAFVHAAVSINSPGGTSGEIQYNNAGVFGGIPGSLVDGVNGLISLAPTGTGVALTITGDASGSDILDLIMNGGNPAASFDSGGDLLLYGSLFMSGNGAITTGSGGIQDITVSSGTAGQVLSSNGPGAGVEWITAGTGTVTSVSFTGGLISVANPTTTPALTVAGTSGGVPYFSSASTWATSAVLPAGDFVLGGGAGSAPTASFSVVTVAKGGTGTGSTLTGLIRGSASAFTAAEISGDATTSGSNALTLATVNSNVGSFTYASITVNAKGLITAASSGAAPTGTVTSFSAGTLSPLFTTSVATATTTPALSFSLSNAAGGTVFGNPTGSAAAPVYTAVPVLGVNASVAGTLGLATSVASGATITLTNPGALTAYNFELPLTVGAAGSVLTSQAGSAMTWTTQAALGVAWSSLTNATANLTLANAGFNTTFDQTSASSWFWRNTTVATSGTTNASPYLGLAANYWTGSASAQDLWTLVSSLAAGTNGVSTITFNHTGSTGGAQVSVPTLIIPGTSSGSTLFTPGALGGLAVTSTGLIGLTASAGVSVLSGGLILGAPVGGSGGVGTINAATGYYANGIAGVSAGSFSAITAITTMGGIVTQLTGTSDVRLKDSVPYEGGLNEILAITPARYRWNKKGQAHTGLSGDKAYVGFIAQDVQKAIPEAITATEGVEHYLSFDDRPVIAALVNAVKTLAARVKELEVKCQ